MEEQQERFEIFGIVDLFGHQRIAGRISEQIIGGAAFIRVDVPEVEGARGFTKFYGGKAIYSITPTDELTALALANSIQTRPVNIWLSDQSRQLPEPDYYDGDDD